MKRNTLNGAIILSVDKGGRAVVACGNSAMTLDYRMERLEQMLSDERLEKLEILAGTHVGLARNEVREILAEIRRLRAELARFTDGKPTLKEMAMWPMREVRSEY